MSRLEMVRGMIRFARDYTRRFLDNLPPEDWFRQPPGGVTHIAWQVGHLAFAEYRLALLRIRGTRLEDEQLLPTWFLKQFGKDSVPDPDPAKHPAPERIRAVFDRVHERTMVETADIPDADLDQPIVPSHPLVKTKLEVLWYCSQHEMIHAGQIALVRRLLGYAPVW